MKKLLIVLMTLVLITPIFAGGQQDPEPAAEQPAAAEEKMEEITLHVFQHKPYLDDLYKEFALEFKEEYPNVTVEVETIGGGAQWQTVLKSKFAANEGPDIFPIEGTGQYVQWQDYIAVYSNEPWMKTVMPFAKNNMNIDGKQVGMPLNLEGYGYIYNKEIFRKVGISSLPKTLSELENVAKKIKAAGYTPFATGYSTWWVPGLHLTNMAFAHQDDPHGFINQLNAGTASMADNKLFQDLQNVVDLTVEYGDKNPLTCDHNMQIQLFANGQAAMIQQGVWKETPIYEANPDAEIGLLPIPLNNDAAEMDKVAVGVPFYFVVNKTSEPAVQEAANDFLNFLVTTKLGQTYLTEKFGFIPSYTGVSPEGLKGVGMDILKYSGEGKQIPWVFGSYPDGFANEAFNNIQAYIAGRQSWDEVLAKMDAAWQKLKK